MTLFSHLLFNHFSIESPLQSIELHNGNLPHSRNSLQVYEIRNVYLYFPGTFTELNTTQLHHMCTSAKKIPSNIAICGMPLWLTQGLFTRNVVQTVSVIPTVIQCVLFICHQNNGEKVGLSPILSVINAITIGTMLNFNSGNKGHGLKNVTCKQTFNSNWTA